MKPLFTYHFEDEPQFKAVESRAYVANYLRSVRMQPERFALTRAGLHSYRVTLHYPGAPTAIVAAA